MAGIAITKKAKAQKAEWERVCNLTEQQRHAEYATTAAAAWERAWDLLHQEQGWKQETKNQQALTSGGVVFSRQIQDLGKVFRVEAELDADPATLFDLMVKTANEAPLWNPTILESRVVFEIDNCTDLAYYVTAEAGRGTVDSRDFINVRHWKTRDNVFLSVGFSVMHPDFPPCRKYVRGENRPGGGMAFVPVKDHSNKCRLIWIVNTDLKGLLPNKLVEEAIPSVCLETLANLRSRLEQRAQNGIHEK